MQNTTTGSKHILGESRLEALEMDHVLSCGLSPLTLPATHPNHFLPLLGRLGPGTGESRCRLAILKAYFVLINWLIN